MKSDLFVLLLTFVTGLMAGAFVYFDSFRELDEKIPDSVAETHTYEIVMTEYGGCERSNSCAILTLVDKGTYELTAVDATGRRGTKKGNVGDVWQKSITQSLDTAVLVPQAQFVSRAQCASQVDDVDTHYVITYLGTEYVLDTCQTAVNKQIPPISLLDELLEKLLIQYRAS